MAKGTSKTASLQFVITMNAYTTDIGLENAESILHETQHLRIDLQTLQTNEAMAPPTMQHGDWMKPAATQWYQERFKFYLDYQKSGIWKDDYETMKAAGKVKNEQEYINKKINDFVN